MIEDALDRCRKAERELFALHDGITDLDERARLRAKASGVALAISYIEEERRMRHEEFVRQFTGSASSMTEADPTIQVWNAGPIPPDPARPCR